MRQVAIIPRGFSLIELAIVMVIVGVIGAIAVPRLSSVASSTPAAAYRADISAIQAAIDRYTAEHVGKLPHKDKFIAQLTQFTNIDGDVSPIKTTSHTYGPYLRRMPDVYEGPDAESDDLLTTNELSDGNGATEVVLKSARSNRPTAWIYDHKTGRIRVKRKS